MAATLAKSENVTATPILRFAGVSKAFAGVQALADVNLDVMGGEVHALLGENGAGKSTLMKILFGVYKHDAGDIIIEGRPNAAVADPKDALANGIGLVSQEPAIVPQLDVAQNIFLGQSGALSLTQRRAQRAAARQILDPLAPALRETAKVVDLGMADRQIVEIARALARGGRIIAFDEPTSSLTPAERDGLFDIIRGLKRAGKAIIYISHRMSEIQTISDRVTVLRDGASSLPAGRPNSPGGSSTTWSRDAFWRKSFPTTPGDGNLEEGGGASLQGLTSDKVARDRPYSPPRERSTVWRVWSARGEPSSCAAFSAQTDGPAAKFSWTAGRSSSRLRATRWRRGIALDSGGPHAASRSCRS